MIEIRSTNENSVVATALLDGIWQYYFGIHEANSTDKPIMVATDSYEEGGWLLYENGDNRPSAIILFGVHQAETENGIAKYSHETNSVTVYQKDGIEPVFVVTCTVEPREALFISERNSDKEEQEAAIEKMMLASGVAWLAHQQVSV